MSNATLSPDTKTEDAAQTANQKRMLCRSHPDFHIPAGVDVGDGFDGEVLGSQLAEASADSIAIFAKCHYGHAYYPTEIGTPHPGLKCDLLGEAVKGCKKHGVSVTAYLSVFFDTAAVAKHPEWILQKAPKGELEQLEPDNYSPTCVNSGYIEEDLIPMSLEVIDNYDVHELFYDTMTWFRPCFCDKCHAGFGKEIPADDTHENWAEYVVWYKKCFDDAFEKITNAVREHKPEIGVIFNHKWGTREPTAPPKGIEHLSADLWGSGRIASYYSRVMAGTGLSFDYMCGRFMHGLGDWDTSTDETLLYTASATIANTGGYYIIDRMLPDGTLEPRSYEAMKTVFSHINERREYIEDTNILADIAVLCSYDSIIGKDLERFADFNLRKERMKAYEGIGSILTENGRHFLGLSEENLQKRINEFRYVIVPEQAIVSQKTVDALEDYAAKGGHVLISIADIGEQDDLCSIAGVKHQGYDVAPYCYVGTESPFHLKNRRSLIKAVDADTLYQAKGILPVNNDHHKFGHGLAPFIDKDDGAIITRRSVGKGSITCIAAPIFTAYINHKNPNTQKLILKLIDEVAAPAPVRIQSKADVEMTLLRKNDDLIVHLVNHSGKETICSWVFPMTDYLPDINDIDVEIEINGEQPCITACPSGENINYSVDNGVARFRAPTLEAMNSIIVHGYFKGK